jgi:hypothetical protein
MGLDIWRGETRVTQAKKVEKIVILGKRKTKTEVER